MREMRKTYYVSIFKYPSICVFTNLSRIDPALLLLSWVLPVVPNKRVKFPQVSLDSFPTLTFTDLCPILSITKPWTFVDPVQTNGLIWSNSSILYPYYRLSHKLCTSLVLYLESLLTSLGCSTICLFWFVRQKTRKGNKCRPFPLIVVGNRCVQMKKS